MLYTSIKRIVLKPHVKILHVIYVIVGQRETGRGIPHQYINTLIV